VIVNEALARRYFPDEDPIGKRLSHIGANQNQGDPEQYEIVGVVGDVHQSSLTTATTPEVYLPYQQNSWTYGNFFVRTAHDPTSLTTRFTDEIRASDRTVPVVDVQLLTQAISGTIAQTRFCALLFTLFGATGLVLTLTGIYGVISYTVAQRTREIGVRMALGAQRRDVVRLVVQYGVTLTACGLVIGLAGSLALTRFLASLLFGVTAHDPATFVAITVLLAIVALIACLVPAWRATKVDPLIALRYE
jgi:putative ABC transport system permease protein